jgi:hypothetical protein
LWRGHRVGFWVIERGNVGHESIQWGVTPVPRENPVTLQAREPLFVRTNSRDPREEAETLPVPDANRNPHSASNPSKPKPQRLTKEHYP